MPYRRLEIAARGVVHYIDHPSLGWDVGDGDVRLLASIENEQVLRVLFQPGDKPRGGVGIGRLAVETLHARATEFSGMSRRRQQ